MVLGLLMVAMLKVLYLQHERTVMSDDWANGGREVGFGRVGLFIVQKPFEMAANKSRDEGSNGIELPLMVVVVTSSDRLSPPSYLACSDEEA